MLIRLLPALVFLASVVAAQDTAGTRPDILELIQAVNATETIDRMFTAEVMEGQIRTMLKPENAPADRREKMEQFIKEFSKEFVVEAQQNRKELLAIMAAVYSKHFTPDDVKALLAFYKTPAGKRMVAAAPAISLEVMQSAQAWGQQLGQRVGARVGQKLEGEKK